MSWSCTLIWQLLQHNVLLAKNEWLHSQTRLHTIWQVMGSHTSWCLQSYCHFQRWCSFLQQVSFVHHSEPPKTGCVSVCNDRMCMCAFVCVCVCLCVCMYVCVFNTCSQYFLYYSAGQKHLLWLILRSHVVMHQLWFIPLQHCIRLQSSDMHWALNLP